MSLGVEMLVILVMLVLNAIFASFEIALTAVSRARLTVLVQEGHRRARSALFLKEHMEHSLAVVQIGITVAGAVGAAFGGAGMEENLSPWLERHLGWSEAFSDVMALILFVVPLSGVTILIGELVPKMIAIRHPERVVMRWAPALRVFGLVFYPVIRLFEASVQAIMRRLNRNTPVDESRDRSALRELRAAATLARTSQLIEPLQERIVHAAAQLSRRTVHEIMLPADQIVAIPQDSRLSSALLLAHQYLHTRFPVIEPAVPTPRYTGYVNFKDIVFALKMNPADPSIEGILRPLLHFEDRLPLAGALDQLTRQHEHIALVTNATGTVTGMITLEDVIEDLIGDIQDEYDRLPATIRALSDGWLMGGGVPLPEAMKAVGRSEPPLAPATTLADWCEAAAGPLAGGERLTIDGLRVDVRKVRRRRLLEAIIGIARPNAPTSNPPDTPS
jgi:putative hemolysin